MTNLSIVFAPDLPWAVLAIISGLGAVLVAAGLWARLRGGIVRLFAWAILTCALFNPSILVEEREPLKSVVAVITDRSGSQKLADRKAETDALHAAVLGRLTALGRFEIREAEIGDELSRNTDVSTALFKGMASALRDVPPEQIGGAVLITDGQVHDIPENLGTAGVRWPVHALITGSPADRDRRMTIVEAPKFSLVGEAVDVTYRVMQQNIPTNVPVDVVIRLDGEAIGGQRVLPGEITTFSFKVPHGGHNILEFDAAVEPGEVTAVNNTAVVTVNGIRENLRVLLISGEPHAGERTWRNLLKSDPAVDLVHFTILRPPDKQDGTPINQLSLIAFPTRELFVEKIDQFDLIIFDRYRRRSVLPLLYFDNIARYVNDGGALLVAAGPEYGEGDSVAEPLAAILPGQPDGTKIEAPFKPMISQSGLRHPVTRGLDGWRENDPQWGRWFRSIGISQTANEALMTGKDSAPLLLLNRVGEGRVALILSDQAWLWARGFEGGGPYVQLLRRTAHWLMKEPELDEERLSATAEGENLRVERQSLGNEAGDVQITAPDGSEIRLPLVASGPGLWRGEAKMPGFGLYRLSEGDQKTLVHVGPANPREYGDVVSTTALLEPVLSAGRGSARRATGEDIPRIVPVRSGATAAGPGWIGLENTGASILRNVSRIPLFTGLIGLALLLVAMSAMWAREGR
jgi:hypothetical protein